MMHGRLLAGLAAWAIEREHGEARFQPVRLTVDLFRSPPMEPATVTTTLVRAGGRVRAVDAAVVIGDIEVGRASSLFLLRSEPLDEQDGALTLAWNAAPPEEVARVEQSVDMPFEVLPLDGEWFGASLRRVWLRETRPLVSGVELTPFVRAAMAADFASPLANFGASGLDYINADATLHLGRLPVGEWIGVAVDDRVVAEGVSVAQCVFHDAAGPIGWSSVCGVRTPRMSHTT
jgi:Thioesterase-like superfamily